MNSDIFSCSSHSSSSNLSYYSSPAVPPPLHALTEQRQPVKGLELAQWSVTTSLKVVRKDDMPLQRPLPVHQFVDEARTAYPADGRYRLAYVHGPPGSGKTRLLYESAEMMLAAGVSLELGIWGGII